MRRDYADRAECPRCGAAGRRARRTEFEKRSGIQALRCPEGHEWRVGVNGDAYEGLYLIRTARAD
jgi:hypothetical protein